MLFQTNMATKQLNSDDTDNIEVTPKKSETFLNQKRKLKEINSEEDLTFQSNKIRKVKNEIKFNKENYNVRYMEAKQKLLSALNSVKNQKLPTKPKAHEILMRLKRKK